jgi:hypothetical protein
LEIAFQYFDRLNSDQEKWLSIYFKNKEENTKKRRAQGEDESSVSLMYYNQEKRMALDFQLNYMILKNIADWPNNYYTISKKEIERILKKERQQR